MGSGSSKKTAPNKEPAVPSVPNSQTDAANNAAETATVQSQMTIVNTTEFDVVCAFYYFGQITGRIQPTTSSSGAPTFCQIKSNSTGTIHKPVIKIPMLRFLVYSIAPMSCSELRSGAALTTAHWKLFPKTWIDDLLKSELVLEIDEYGMLYANPSNPGLTTMAHNAAKSGVGHVQTGINKRLSAIHAAWVKNVVPRVDSFRDSLIEQQHRLLDEAKVRFSSECCPQERGYLLKRRKTAAAALSAYLGMEVAEDELPTIGLCGSGGGYRAMVATSGSLSGMQSCGLLDCCQYLSVLSGSTWATAQWIGGGGGAVDDLLSGYVTKMGKDMLKTIPARRVMELCMREKIAFRQNFNLVDVWGWGLTHSLLVDHPVDALGQARLSMQCETVASGVVPLPLYTAVEKDGQRYHWYEFSPFEVGSIDDAAYVPTWAFGRVFQGGTSVDCACEPPLGLLLGTFGSAFCATMHQVAADLRGDQDLLSGGFALTVLEKIVYQSKVNIADKHLVNPAAFRNPLFATLDADGHPRRAAANKETRLMDAGLHFNLPFPPLLRPEREVDIIFALDASATPVVAMKEAAAFARDTNLPFPDIPADLNGQQALTVLPRSRPGCPIILYLPLAANATVSADFDPQKNVLEKGFCDTQNFLYTPEQIQLLSGVTRANLLASQAAIKQVLRDEVLRKRAANKQNT